MSTNTKKKMTTTPFIKAMKGNLLFLKKKKKRCSKGSPSLPFAKECFCLEEETDDKDNNVTESSFKKEDHTTRNSTNNITITPTSNTTTTIATLSTSNGQEPSQRSAVAARNSEGLSSGSSLEEESSSGDGDIDDDGDGNNNNNNKVSFGQVRIRCHERVLNQRVSGKFAGLELGWGHAPQSLVHDVDEYEKIQQQDDDSKKNKSSLYFPSDYPSENKSSCNNAKKGEGEGNGHHHECRKIAAPQRLQVLNEYGYDIKHVLRIELEKKRAMQIRLAKEEQEAKKGHPLGTKLKKLHVRYMW